MKKAVFLTLITALALAVPGSANAGDRSLADLRDELEALTDAITTQMKLLEIMERVNRPDEAAVTRDRLCELIVIQQRLLAEMNALFGGDAPGAPKLPARAVLPGVGDLGQPPDKPSPNAEMEARKARALAAKPLPERPTTEIGRAHV